MNYRANECRAESCSSYSDMNRPPDLFTSDRPDSNSVVRIIAGRGKLYCF